MVGHRLPGRRRKIRDRPTTTRSNYITEHPAHGSVSWYGADDVQLRHDIVIFFVLRSFLRPQQARLLDNILEILYLFFRVLHIIMYFYHCIAVFFDVESSTVRTYLTVPLRVTVNRLQPL